MKTKHIRLSALFLILSVVIYFIPDTQPNKESVYAFIEGIRDFLTIHINIFLSIFGYGKDIMSAKQIGLLYHVGYFTIPILIGFHTINKME